MAQRRHLTGLLLTKTDLPAGWSASAATGSSTANDAATQAAFARCVGITDTFAQRVATANSPSFTRQARSVSASATLYRSQAAVRADASAFRDKAKATACMTSTLTEQLKNSGPSVAKLKSVDITVGPRRASDPRNVIGRISGTMTIALGSAGAKVYLDIVYVSGPKIEAEISFTRLNAPFDATTKSTLLKTVAARVANG